jgi:uncharacterized membrane protein YkvA (DUF1232 family)
MRLRTVEDLTLAHEWLLNQQRDGKIDAKTADAMNTTIKGAVYLNGKLRIDAAKLFLQAAIKKVVIPVDMMPDLASLAAKGNSK